MSTQYCCTIKSDSGKSWLTQTSDKRHKRLMNVNRQGKYILDPMLLICKLLTTIRFRAKLKSVHRSFLEAESI